MATKTKLFIGLLILVVLTSSVYIMLPEKVRIDVKNTKTLISVWEDDKWALGATEYLNLFDGTKKMRASSREVTHEINDNIVTITRTAYWKDNIKTIHEYVFDSSISDVELIPIKEKLTCFNCQGKIVHFEYKDILYTGITKKITSPFSFGHNMKLEWQEGAYYSKVFQQKYASDKIIIRYKAVKDVETYFVRIFDPPTEVTGCSEITASGDYILMNDIADINSTTNCINITGENITFDCQGYNIDADDIKDRAINIDKGVAHVNVNVTVKNCNLTDWDTYAIYAKYADYVTIDNVSISDVPDDGTYVYVSDYFVINNSDFAGGTDSVTDDGIRMYHADDSTIENTKVSGGCGLNLQDNMGTKRITDVNITSTAWDITTSTSLGSSTFCNNNILTNVNGSNGKEVVWFNSAVVLDGWNNNFSQIILCNADNSNLNDIIYDGDASNRRNGIRIVGSDNVILENSSFFDYEEIYVISSNSVIFRNNTFNNSDSYGLYLYYIDDGFIYDNYFENSDSFALYVSASDDNVISNNTFQQLTEYGIRVSGVTSYRNIIFNNLFNCSSGDKHIYDAFAQDWNTSIKTGTRIYSDGTQIGGNFYANNSGDGFSETCADSNTDGFCDTNYTGDGNAIDYHPLSVLYSAGADVTSPELTIQSPSTLQTSSIIEFNITSNEAVSYCVISLDDFVSNITMEEFSSTIFNFTNESMGDGSYTANFSCNDTSDNWNSTEGISFTVDTIYPTLSIAYPTATTYSTNITVLNYTTDGEFCWYSVDSGSSNSSEQAANTNWTGITTTSEGSNTWSLYCNDTSNLINSTSVTFTIDLAGPTVTISYPVSGNYYDSTVTEFNFSAADENLDSCWYSTDSGDTNTSATCNDNVTGLSSTEGSNTWTAYANDTSNNITSDTTTFTQDTTYPEVSITYPTNNTNFTTTDVDINYTYSDTNLEACWYSNDSGVNNATVTCGNNLTTQTWEEGSNTVLIFVNDSAGNINQSDVIFNIDTTTDYPSWSNNLTNASDSTKYGDTVYFNVTLTDDTAGGKQIFSYYDGSSWTNDSSVSWSTPVILEETRTITGTRGLTIYWYWWFNNSVSNINETDIWSFTIDNTAPVANSVDITCSDNENRENGNLTGGWTYSDVDSDTETKNETLWFNDTEEVIDLQNFTLVNFANTTTDENWTFSVRVYDGYDWGEWVNSSSFSITSVSSSTITLNPGLIENISQNFMPDWSIISELVNFSDSEILNSGNYSWNFSQYNISTNATDWDYNFTNNATSNHIATAKLNDTYANAQIWVVINSSWRVNLTTSYQDLFNLTVDEERHINVTIDLINISQTYVNWTITENTAKWDFNITFSTTI